MRYFLLLITALLLFSGAGCTTLPAPPLDLRAGTTVDTLSSMIALSVRTPKGGAGGNGYLLYRRPDRFHLVMLTPFGTTAMEFFAQGEQVTVIIPSKGTAYAGTFAELPAEGALRGWRLLQWVVDGDPLYDPAKPGTIVRYDSNGQPVTLTYDEQGLLAAKKSAEGDRISYREYQAREGLPFPGVIEFADQAGNSVKITLDEPEFNTPLEEVALTPALDGLTILPLSALKVM